MHKTFQYRLYPTRSQEQTLTATLETCRRWYNDLLAERKAAYAERGETIGKYVQLRRVKAQKAWYRSEQQTLRRLQRRVSRRKHGSSNRRKAVRAAARQHERISNRRKDFLNKLAMSLIEQYDRIAVEDLRITNLVRNHYLAKSILDAGWGYFIARLHAKAEEAGRVVVEINPAWTSKTCSGCGYRFEHLSLSERWIECRCGVSLDRDHNAALNILYRAGQVRWGTSTSLDVLPQEAVGV